MTVWEARVTVGSAIPGLAILGAVRKQAEPRFKSKVVSGTSPGPGHQIPPPGARPAYPAPTAVIELHDQKKPEGAGFILANSSPL